MKYNFGLMRLFLFSFFLFLFFKPTFGQGIVTDSLSPEEKNQRIKQLLDYRFKGGSGAFEYVFFSTITDLPIEAKNVCALGTVILIFMVDCDNNLSDLRLRNPLNHGINELIQKFYFSTKEMWNPCHDDKYTQFEISILFTLEGVETNNNAYLTFEAERQGFRCKSDSYYFSEFERLKNKSPKKALKMLDPLIQRDPYNYDLYERRKTLLEKSHN